MQRVLVGSGVDGYGLQIQFLARPDNTYSNLATISNQHLFESARWSDRGRGPPGKSVAALAADRQDFRDRQAA